MPLKLFVEYTDELDGAQCYLSSNNAEKLGLPSGGTVKLIDPATKKTIRCEMIPKSENMLDFSIKVPKSLISSANFKGLELEIDIFTEGDSIQSEKPIMQPPPVPKSAPKSSVPPPPPGPTQTSTTPSPRAPTVPAPPKTVPSPPKPTSIPPSPQTEPITSSHVKTGSSIEPEPIVEEDPYPDRIEVDFLQTHHEGSQIVSVHKAHSSLDGKVYINENLAGRLNLYPNALIGWEDPLTREKGSARIKMGKIADNTMMMDENTIFDTHVEADKIVVYSLEPPIEQQDVLTLELEGRPEMGGYIEVSPRNALTLEIEEGSIVSGEDDLTGAFFAGKIRINNDLDDQRVIVDQELLDASGVGSYEVELKKNIRKIIPLQSLDLGVAPISGDNVWDIISQSRQNIDVIKQWLSNYIIFKGIKLRWKRANIGIEILNTVPDLSGDVLASISPSTTIELRPTGLVTFNAILIIDISRSMMARDVRVTNIGPALEGIKAAMQDPDIQTFLKNFKPGINVPRRLSAAFAAILFLSEKVGRGFGEKVSVIRFADQAQVLPMSGGKLWMDSSSGQKGELENCAKTIVQEIGNAYGQATNMGAAIGKARELLSKFEEQQANQPSMIVLLTDGSPTDGHAFMDEIEELSKNQNVVLYIIGLGNADDEEMKNAALKCDGEYFKPEDSGELLKWYSKRARDLTLKIRREME